jgi:type VI secretion system secreted protein Hcp
VDTFIKFDGVEGESTHKDHKGEIDVLSWNWGVSNDASPGGGGGGGGAGAGKVRMHELRFVHRYDAASPRLAETAAAGKHIKEAFLSVSRGGQKIAAFLKVSMKDVLVTEVDVSGDSDTVTEEVALHPAWIRFDYSRQSPNGAAGGTSSFTWDGDRVEGIKRNW